MRKERNGVCWHPLLIKWCLYLCHQSGKAFETLRDAGIALPFQRTLRDYSNVVKAGFSPEVDCKQSECLLKVGKERNLQSWQHLRVISVSVVSLLLKEGARVDTVDNVSVYMIVIMIYI